MPTTGLLTGLVAEGRIGQHRIALVLKAEVLAVALDIQPDEIDPSTLTIEAPFVPPRRGVEGKIVVGGSRAAMPLYIANASSSPAGAVVNVRFGLKAVMSFLRHVFAPAGSAAGRPRPALRDAKPAAVNRPLQRRHSRLSFVGKVTAF